MIIKVDWFPVSNAVGTLPPRMSHTYEADDYFAEWRWSENAKVKKQYPILRLVINRGQETHELCLSKGDTAFVMNDSGKTIEIHRTVESIE